jgi:hypothetical protein
MNHVQADTKWHLIAKEHVDCFVGGTFNDTVWTYTWAFIRQQGLIAGWENNKAPLGSIRVSPTATFLLAEHCD